MNRQIAARRLKMLDSEIASNFAYRDWENLSGDEREYLTTLEEERSKLRADLIADDEAARQAEEEHAREVAEAASPELKSGERLETAAQKLARANAAMKAKSGPKKPREPSAAELVGYLQTMLRGTRIPADRERIMNQIAELQNAAN